jgi:hypothetical protein
MPSPSGWRRSKQVRSAGLPGVSDTPATTLRPYAMAEHDLQVSGNELDLIDV